MKKISIYILTFVLVLSLTACNAKAPSSSQSPENLSSTAQAPVTYTKEFSYLPTYSNMELQDVAQPDNIQMVNAKYIIKNTTTDIVLNTYTETLTNDGWTVKTLSRDNKPYCLNAQKGNHIATLLPEQSGNDVLLIVASK